MTVPAPAVSVLMPTFRHGWIIERAMASLLWQDFADWELVVVDDASPDDTARILKPYRADRRVRYTRLDRNGGLGDALNTATALARGRYLAYLPSDDVWFPGHLRRLVEVLDRRPDVHLAYGGVQTHGHWSGWRGMTLQGDAAVGREREALATGIVDGGPPHHLTNRNVLAMVQVLHRRTLEDRVRWTSRREEVSDDLETTFWSALLNHGASFAAADGVSCEWTDHPDQRHKIIAEPDWLRVRASWATDRSGRGLAAYRAYYGVPGAEPLNWRPTRGAIVDQRTVPTAPPAPPADPGLQILLVGSLGFNPDRIAALARAGHRLHGLWLPAPERWDTTGSTPDCEVAEVTYGPGWRDRVAELRPDVIYALLNHHAVPLIHEVVRARLGVPLFFHFKESPFGCLRHGTWPMLAEILAASDGHLFISEENAEWFRHHLPRAVGRIPSLVLDGDMPAGRWSTEDWSPRLSAADGEVHTVCCGRPSGLDDMAEILARGVHLHLYGGYFQEVYADWIRQVSGTGRVHLHPAVEPAQWVHELSRYDAAWLHGFPGRNGGDVRASAWSDLNIPSRLGTYAAAGLPCLVRDGPVPARTSVGSLLDRYGVGIHYRDAAELVDRLGDTAEVGRHARRMRERRAAFTFDAQVDRLVRFFRTGQESRA